MTRLETSQAGVTSSQEQGFNFNLPGFSGSLGAPGLGVVGPESAGANQLLRLSQSLGLLGPVANSVDELNQRKKALSKQEQAEQARIESQIASEQQGLASQHFKNNQETIKIAIENGEFDSFLGDERGENIIGFIGSFNEGQPEAYTAKSRELFEPFLNTQLAKRQQFLQEQSLNESKTLLAEAAATATTTVEINDLVAQAKSLPNVTETDAISTVILPTLRAAAESGNVEQFNIAREALGDRFPLERQEAELNLERSLNKIENDQHKAAVEVVEGLRLKGAPAELIEETIQRMADRGELTKEKARILSGQVETEERRRLAEQSKMQAKAQRQAIDEVVGSENVASVMNARSTGGAAGFEDIEIELADGTTYTKTAREQKDEAIGLAFEQIERNAPTPEAALNRQVAVLADNNAEYAPWEAQLGSGFSISDSWFLRVSEGESTAPPPLLLESYQLYKDLGAVSPVVRNRHIPSDDADIFYRMAETAERRLSQGDPERSLLLAATATSKVNSLGGTQLDSLKKTKIEKAVKSIKYDTILPFDERRPNNVTDLGREIENVAQLYTMMGVDPDTAVDEAKKIIKEDYQIVNNWAVDTSDERLPESINKIVKSIAKQYVENNPDEGISKNLVTLSKGPGDTWLLIDGNTGLPLPTQREGSIVPYFDGVRTRENQFTTKELSMMEAAIEGRAAVEQQIDRAELIKRTVNKDRTPTPITIERGRP